MKAPKKKFIIFICALHSIPLDLSCCDFLNTWFHHRRRCCWPIGLPPMTAVMHFKPLFTRLTQRTISHKLSRSISSARHNTHTDSTTSTSIVSSSSSSSKPNTTEFYVIYKISLPTAFLFYFIIRPLGDSLFSLLLNSSGLIGKVSSSSRLK